jgi:hypothetical protein
VPTLIGWLSLCLLSAACGRTVDERWHKLWMQAGAIGLVAAVGLGSLERAQLVRKRWVRDQALRLRFEGRLAELNERNAALELINDGISQVHRYAISQRRILRGYPLKVVPVEKGSDTFDLASAHSIPGSLINLSSSIASFEHGEAFTGHVVLLTFNLEQQRLCFVVDITGTQTIVDGFVSSGTLMAVGVPALQELDENLVQPVPRL